MVLLVKFTTSVEDNDTIKIGLDSKITQKIDDTADKASKNETAISEVKAIAGEE